MAWAAGDTLGAYIEDNYNKKANIQGLLQVFRMLEASLRKQSIAHGDLQNGNALVGSALKLIDYDGVYVSGMPLGRGTELGHPHFQHPKRSRADFGPAMDRFSFIVLDVSLRALMERPELFRKYSNGENILFSASDYRDPSNASVFSEVRAITALQRDTDNFARVCQADVSSIPHLEDFLTGRNIPAVRFVPIRGGQGTSSGRVEPAPYIGAFRVVDAAEFAMLMSCIGDRIELIGRIVAVQTARTRHGKPYAFLMFGPKDGDIARVTIWSEGLGVLARHNVTPDQSWVGKWASVTGLVEQPYRYPRRGNRHVGITITDSSQIRFIDENEANRRLRSKAAGSQAQSKGGSRTNGNQSILDQIGVGKRGAYPGSIRQPQTTNQQILTGIGTTTGSAAHKAQAGARSSGSSTSPAPRQSAQSSRSSTPAWVWWAIALIALVLIAILL
jgi:hypothetical protein